VICKPFYSLTAQVLAIAGAFYFFNHLKSLSEWLPIPGTITLVRCQLEATIPYQINFSFVPIAQPSTSILVLYRYIKFPSATTKFFAPYRHHGYHLLA
jgi:hypothetical protein